MRNAGNLKVINSLLVSIRIAFVTGLLYYLPSQHIFAQKFADNEDWSYPGEKVVIGRREFV